jgi:hypothetical protein
MIWDSSLERPGLLIPHIVGKASYMPTGEALQAIKAELTKRGIPGTDENIAALYRQAMRRKAGLL